MSLSYNVNQNKNIYISSEIQTEMFLFEIFIKKNNKNITIRKIKNTKNDKILSITDNIKFDDINRIKIKFTDFNKPNNNSEFKIKLDKNNNSYTLKDKNIHIEISKITLGLTECNYQLLF